VPVRQQAGLLTCSPLKDVAGCAGAADDDRLTYTVYLACFAALTLPICFLDFRASHHTATPPNPCRH